MVLEFDDSSNVENLSKEDPFKLASRLLPTGN